MVIITEVEKSFWEDCLQSFIIRQSDRDGDEEEVSCVLDIMEGKDVEGEVEKILSTQKVDLPFRLNICRKVWGPKTKVKIFILMFFLSWLMLLRMIIKDGTFLKLTIPIFCCLTLYGIFIITICLNWYSVVQLRTYRRSNSKCPSNKSFPRLLTNGNLENRFKRPDDYDLNLGSDIDEYVGGVKYGVYKEKPFPINERGKYFKTMSHQYLSFWEDLYVSLLLYPGATFQLFFGTKFHGGLFQFLFIRIKGFFVGENEENLKDNEKESILLDLILETTLSTMIENLRTTTTNDLEGVLVIHGCTNFTKNKEILVGTLRVGLNISKRRILFCTFDKSNISASEALAITAVALFGLVHSVTHCYANWGTCSEILSSSFLRLMSLLTIKYNHMGVAFKKISGFVQTLGISKYIGFLEGRAAIHHGVHTLKPCSDLESLKNHSKFVDFFLKTKKVFVKEFNRYKEDFPGIDCEAMFQGTIVHSIDHTNSAILLKPGYFSSSSPNSEMARFVLCCFVEKPPSLIETRFSKAPHPLYRNVYTFASKIDKRLADSMECCIDM